MTDPAFIGQIADHHQSAPGVIDREEVGEPHAPLRAVVPDDPKRLGRESHDRRVEVREPGPRQLEQGLRHDVLAVGGRPEHPGVVPLTRERPRKPHRLPPRDVAQVDLREVDLTLDTLGCHVRGTNRAAPGVERPAWPSRWDSDTWPAT